MITDCEKFSDTSPSDTKGPSRLRGRTNEQLDNTIVKGTIRQNMLITKFVNMHNSIFNLPKIDLYIPEEMKNIQLSKLINGPFADSGDSYLKIRGLTDWLRTEIDSREKGASFNTEKGRKFRIEYRRIDRRIKKECFSFFEHANMFNINTCIELQKAVKGLTPVDCDQWTKGYPLGKGTYYYLLDVSWFEWVDLDTFEPRDRYKTFLKKMW